MWRAVLHRLGLRGDASGSTSRRALRRRVSHGQDGVLEVELGVCVQPRHEWVRALVSDPVVHLDLRECRAVSGVLRGKEAYAGDGKKAARASGVQSLVPLPPPLHRTLTRQRFMRLRR
jgi:hypothetical protein